MGDGSATLNWSLLSQELVDKKYTYVGNIIIGGEDALTPVDGSWFISEDAMTKLDEGVLLRWRIRKEQK